MAGIDSLGLRDQVDLIVVSDHGMATIRPRSAGVLDDYVPATGTRSRGGRGARIAPKAGYADSVYRRLKGANPHLHVYWKADVPARFHYDSNPRIPAIVATAG